MALSVTESAAVNDLVHCLNGDARYGGGGRYTEQDLREALRVLTAGAHKRLGAGFRPEQIATLLLANYSQEPYVSVESIHMALRDAHRNDSAADAVEFVSDLVGWSADDDPELQEAK